jgi:hypothetical protein
VTEHRRSEEAHLGIGLTADPDDLVDRFGPDFHPMLRPWLEEYGRAAGWAGPVVLPWGNDKRELERACERAGRLRRGSNNATLTPLSWPLVDGDG